MRIINCRNRTLATRGTASCTGCQATHRTGCRRTTVSLECRARLGGVTRCATAAMECRAAMAQVRAAAGPHVRHASLLPVVAPRAARQRELTAEVGACSIFCGDRLALHGHRSRLDGPGFACQVCPALLHPYGATAQSKCEGARGVRCMSAGLCACWSRVHWPARVCTYACVRADCRTGPACQC